MRLQFTVEPPSASSSTPAPVRRGSWVPIRSLGPRHRDRRLRPPLVRHGTASQLRSGYEAGNEQISP